MERFVGVLIEHFGGAFPTWLAPEQVRVLTISEKTLDYGLQTLAALREAGIRATLDDSSERIQAKIRVAADRKIPYLAVVGPQDAEQHAVSVRARGVRRNLGALPLAEFVQTLADEASSRGRITVTDRHFATAAL
jgi:threonyl-tRNA synthetase